MHALLVGDLRVGDSLFERRLHVGLVDVALESDLECRLKKLCNQQQNKSKNKPRQQ